MRIALLIRALQRGGAETQLAVLAEGLSSKGHEVHVVSFYADGPLAAGLRQAGVAVHTADKRGRRDMSGFAVRLIAALRRIRPEVLYSSMPAANIAGCLAARLAGRPALAWRLAASDMELARYGWFDGLSYRVEAWCTAAPRLIVANSRAGRDAALNRGFAPERVQVVRNGIRSDVFRPDAEAGRARRRRWGLDDNSWVIGQVARSDPKKGYEDFIDAAQLLCRQREDVQFVCLGVDSGDYAGRLQQRAARHGIAGRMHWLGAEDDMAPAYNALDINTLASRFGEGCPNAVGEAMACGVPCAVTDVGDSALMVGAAGEVVSPGSPEALAQAWLRLLDRLAADREAMAAAARARIVQEFSVERYVEQTERLLLALRA